MTRIKRMMLRAWGWQPRTHLVSNPYAPKTSSKFSCSPLSKCIGLEMKVQQSGGIRKLNLQPMRIIMLASAKVTVHIIVFTSDMSNLHGVQGNLLIIRMPISKPKKIDLITLATPPRAPPVIKSVMSQTSAPNTALLQRKLQLGHPSFCD